MNKDTELEIRCVYAWSYEIGRKDKKKIPNFVHR